MPLSGSNRPPRLRGGQFALLSCAHPIVVLRCVQCTLCLRERREYIMRYYGERERKWNREGRKGEGQREGGGRREGRRDKVGDSNESPLIIYHTISSSRAFSSFYASSSLLDYLFRVCMSLFFVIFNFTAYLLRWSILRSISGVFDSFLLIPSHQLCLFKWGSEGRQGKGEGVLSLWMTPLLLSLLLLTPWRWVSYKNPLQLLLLHSYRVSDWERLNLYAENLGEFRSIVLLQFFEQASLIVDSFWETRVQICIETAFSSQILSNFWL